MRAGYSEFQDPGEQSEASWAARRKFLDALRIHVPSVLENLKTQLLPAYQELDKEWKQEPTILNNRITAGWTDLRMASAGHRATKLLALLDALSAWARTYHLEVDWFLDSALATLYRWDMAFDLTELQEPRRSGDFPISRDELEFKFVHHGWITKMWTRAEYERRVRPAFDAHLKAYLDRVEAAATQQGLPRTPEWRKRGDKVARRFEWLVLWHVLEWRYRRVVEAAGGGMEKRTTVRDGIWVAAKEVGLTPRKGRPGRPRIK